VYAAHGDDVVFTMVDGEVRYDDGEHVGVDADAVRERATRQATRVVEAAGIDALES
jgi:cytosine/adenosine deaminase-related metal-dependent hydrolase